LLGISRSTLARYLHGVLKVKDCSRKNRQGGPRDSIPLTQRNQQTSEANHENKEKKESPKTG